MYGPEPTKAHERLARLAGTWEGDEIMHPSPWAPRGQTARARRIYRVALGGFAVIGDYEQSLDGRITFSGHGVHTIDPDGRVALHWFDCMGQPPNVFRGDFDGDELILECIGTEGGSPWSRSTYDFSGAGVLTTKMEMSRDGRSYTTLLDGTYRRSD